LSELFRQEVLDARSQKLAGDISLAQPLSIKMITTLIVVIVITILIFLLNSHYARKETVRGYLTPNKGLIKTYAYRNGTVDTLHVSEGDKVNEGMPLATIILKRSMISGDDLSEVLIDELKIQKDILIKEELVSHLLYLKKQNKLKDDISNVKEFLIILSKTKKLIEKKLSIQLLQHNQYKALYQKGHFSNLDFQSKEKELIDIQQEFENIQSSILQQNKLLKNSLSELSIQPHLYSSEINVIKRRLSELQRKINEAQSNYRYVIRATEAGVIAAIQVHEGGMVVNSRPLMSILPQEAELIAVLLVPTRSAGFVKIGNETRLRFDAFPYQRFGFIKSSIQQIDRALLLNGEADIPMELEEPIYRVRAKLKTQIIMAHGEEFSLKNGMIFEADIVLEKRTLMEWMLGPMYSLTDRVG
jgi:membrane fusion protein